MFQALFTSERLKAERRGLVQSLSVVLAPIINLKDDRSQQHCSFFCSIWPENLFSLPFSPLPRRRLQLLLMPWSTGFFYRNWWFCSHIFQLVLVFMPSRFLFCHRSKRLSWLELLCQSSSKGGHQNCWKSIARPFHCKKFVLVLIPYVGTWTV